LIGFQILLLDIALALILSKVLGYLFEKIKQPTVVGEIIAGVILGGSVLGIFVPKTIINFEIPAFGDFAQLGIIFLLFLSGMEIEFDKIRKTGEVATISTLGGVIVPLTLGYLAGTAFGYSTKESFVIGVLLAATSIGITARTMMDLHLLNTDVGACSLSASVMDDIIGLILIIVVVGTGSLFVLSFKIAIFFFFTLLIGLKIISKVMDIGDQTHSTDTLVAFSIAICLIFGVIAGETVIAQIEGAFIAGLIISTTVQSKRILPVIRTMGYALFIPLFFVHIGTMVKLSIFLIPKVLILAGMITFIGIIGKIVGRGIGARVGGFTTRKSLQVGAASIPRMEVALVSLMVAIHAGIIEGAVADTLIAATFVFVTVTTLIAPSLIKYSFKRELAEVGGE
jgi:Kef-type K+ transport system membrane component KefB